MAANNGSQHLKGDSSLNLGYGWWTKTLDIPLHSEVSEATNLIHTALPLFPNLANLTIQGWVQAEGDKYEGIANAIQTYTPKLQYLGCRQVEQRRAVAGSVFFQIPSLRALRTCWGRTVSEQSSTQFKRDKLTSLSLIFDGESDIPIHIANTLPSLTSLYLRWPLIEQTHTIQLVEAIGERLLELGLTLGLGDGYDAPVSIVEILLGYCPNLRRLLWGRSSSYQPAPFMMLSSRQFPSVELLGVSSPWRTLTKIDWEQCYPLSRFPNLKTIRLVDVLESRLPVIGNEEVSFDAVQDVPLGIVVENALGNVIA